MNWRRAAVLALGGYLIGSVSFARIVGRRAGSGDLEEIAMPLPGGAEIDYRGVTATSVAARSGPVWGVVTGVLDASKAALPTLVARRLWPDDSSHLVVATGVLVGHNYPLYHGFRGGKGQTPFYGTVLAVDPLAVPAANAAAVLVGVGLLKEMLAAYTLGMWFTVPWFLWRGRRPEAAYALLANGLFTVAMIPEIRDYVALRRDGQLAAMSSWREFVTSYPALAARRRPPAP